MLNATIETRRVHFEIGGSSDWCAPVLQVADFTGICRRQRLSLRRLARPEDWRAQTTVLGNQQ